MNTAAAASIVRSAYVEAIDDPESRVHRSQQVGEEYRVALKYIHTCFENASPLDWEVDAEGVIHVRLLYDHERGSVNRAAGPWHFQLHARAGDAVALVLENFDNIWNGRPGSPISERTS